MSRDPPEGRRAPRGTRCLVAPPRPLASHKSFPVFTPTLYDLKTKGRGTQQGVSATGQGHGRSRADGLSVPPVSPTLTVWGSEQVGGSCEDVGAAM